MKENKLEWKKGQVPRYDRVPEEWRALIQREYREADYCCIYSNLRSEIEKNPNQKVNPAPQDVFKALELCPPESVRVVILGQDPYPTEKVADGLAFSASNPKGRSLAKIQIALERAGYNPGLLGSLEPWARNGVLLLNTILTVPDKCPLGHKAIGWQDLTAAIIRGLAPKSDRIVFMLFGNKAKNFFKKATKALSGKSFQTIECAHPSARSNAKMPFIQSDPFGVLRDCFLKENGALSGWQPPWEQ
jgi:uracil-DNA glycosylase